MDQKREQRLVEVLVPIEQYSANMSYRKKDGAGREYRSFKLDGRMIELKDDLGVIVWLLPPNFVFCKVEMVPEEEDVEIEETIKLGEEQYERDSEVEGVDGGGSEGSVSSGSEEAS